MSGAVSQEGVSKGTTPAGARDEREAAAWVRGMFGRVAHRYDFLNHLLSFNVDRYWRAYTVRRVRRILERPGARVLDFAAARAIWRWRLSGARAASCSAPISATRCW